MIPAASDHALADPVHDAQQIFRAALEAMSRPGTVLQLERLPSAPPPLSATANGLLLTLADQETSIWLDPLLSAAPAVAEHLRFHTGARIVTAPDKATFAVVVRPQSCPSLDQLAIGTLEFPDRSTTLILQVDRLEAGLGWTLSGPGIRGTARMLAKPIPEGFVAMLSDNRRLFPRGVDVLLCAPHRLAALPRTTRID